MNSSSSDVSVDVSGDEHFRMIVPTAKATVPTSTGRLQQEGTLAFPLISVPAAPLVDGSNGTVPLVPRAVENGSSSVSAPEETSLEAKESNETLVASTLFPLGAPLLPPPLPPPPPPPGAVLGVPSAAPPQPITPIAGNTLGMQMDVERGGNNAALPKPQLLQQSSSLDRLSLDDAPQTLDIDVSRSAPLGNDVALTPQAAAHAAAAPAPAFSVPSLGLPPSFPSVSSLPLQQLRPSSSFSAPGPAAQRDYGDGVLPLLPSPRDTEDNKENALPLACRPMGTLFFATPTTGAPDLQREDKSEAPKASHIRRQKSEFEAVRTSFFVDSGDSTPLVTTTDDPPGKRRKDPNNRGDYEDCDDDEENKTTRQRRRHRRRPLEEKFVYHTEPPVVKEGQSLSSLSTCAISSEQQTPAAKKDVLESTEVQGTAAGNKHRCQRHRYEKGSIRFTPGRISPKDSFRQPRSSVFQNLEDEEDEQKSKEKVAAALAGKRHQMPDLTTSGGPLSTFKKLYCRSNWPPGPTNLGRECRAAQDNLCGTTLEEVLGEQMKQEDSPFTSTPRATVMITIHRMSELHADGGVVHPFVRVWLVHSKTGRPLLLSDDKTPCGLTQPYDLRSRQCRSPQWESEMSLPINVDAIRQAPKESVLLFELLDCGCESVYGFYMPRQGLYPISWGYYFLHNNVGELHTRLDNIHIQMFPYPLRTVWYVRMFQALLPWQWSSEAVYAPSELFLDPNGVLRPEDRSTTDLQVQHPVGVHGNGAVPSVFFTFKNFAFRKVAYQGSLVVSVRVPKDPDTMPRQTDMSAFEEYMLNILVSQSPICGIPRRRSLEDSATPSLNKYLLERRRQSQRRWSISLINPETLALPYDRLEGERTLPPTATLQTCLVSGKVTCMAFSNSGATLALGVTRHLQYVVELRSPIHPEMTVYAELYGHTGHIHHLAYQKEDTRLISCSSDRTVRVWLMSAALYNARRERDVSMTSFSNTALVSQNVCLCCLPHAFPVYTAIFHQDHIVTGGYDAKLTVWKYDNPNADVVRAGSNAKDESVLQLTQNFTPAMQMAVSSNGNTDLYNGRNSVEPSPLLGEQVTQVSNETDAIILSLASNETGHRVWSVSSSGKVCGWRALDEEHRDGHREWQISVTAKQTTDCAGSNEVQVRDRYAIVTCSGAALVYVFDAMSCEQLRVVRTMMPQGTPFTLLPDGLVFVAGSRDGVLHAWDCFDGALCTGAVGYTTVRTKFPIADMAWATNQQLAAFCSTAPCSESIVERVLELPAGNVATRSPLQVELTLIAVVGAKRDENAVITINDKSASDEICQRFGGELSAKRKAKLIALRSEMRRERTKDRDKERLYGDDDGARTTTRVDMGLFMENTLRELPTSRVASTSRIDAILGFWKGLVRQHRHENADESLRNDREMQVRNPSTNRELEYEEEDDSLKQ